MPELIDLHSHVVPEFDDGAAGLDESMAMLALAQQAGFGAVVATPHVMIGVYEHDREALTEALARLEQEMAAQSLAMALWSGAEYYLDDHFFGLLDRGELRPLGPGKHVLVELPLLRIPPMARELAFRMRIKGLVPVLAHPERYNEVGRNPEYGAMLREAGYLLQINLGSLTGMYGKGARKAAEWLLKKDLVDFAASDAHTPKQAAEVYGESLAALHKLAGEDAFRRLLVDNPRAALAPAATEERQP